MPPPKKRRSAIDRLQEVRPGLDILHSLLLNSERAEYERVFGKVANPAQMLNLLLQDPWFTWMRPLSGLMAEMDEALDGKPPLTEGRAEKLLVATLALLSPSEEGVIFTKDYLDALQREPDVVMAHAQIVTIIRS